MRPTTARHAHSPWRNWAAQATTSFAALNSLQARATAQAEADQADIQPPEAEVFATAAGKSINVLGSGQFCRLSERDWSLHAWFVLTITGVPARLQSLRSLKWCDPKDFILEEHTKEMASLMHLGDNKYRIVLGNHGPASPGQAKTKTSFPLDVTLCDDGKYARLAFKHLAFTDPSRDSIGIFGSPGTPTSFDSDAIQPGGSGAPEGYHYMPDGTLMADAAHLTGEGYYVL
eukprot:COSAG06_NODE_2897_length_6120_cov_56.864308_5_plen_231_part_00